MVRKKENVYCPINTDGCRNDTGDVIDVCMFWRKRKGCELEVLIKDLRAIPNLFRRIERQVEEGKQIK